MATPSGEGLLWTQDYVDLDRDRTFDGLEGGPAHEAEKTVTVTPIFSADGFMQAVKYPVIVESWSKVVGPHSSGSLRRKFQARFTDAEREKLSKMHAKFKVWYTRSATPYRVGASLETIHLLQRAVAFFADPDRAEVQNPGGKDDVMTRPHWNHYFIIQISRPRTWVRWHYVKPGDSIVDKQLHVSPKRTWIGPRSGGFWYKFKIPTRSFDGYAPKIYDEVESWGWRLYSDDSPQCNGEFNLVGGIEEALSEAKDSFRHQGLIPDGIMLVDEDGSAENVPMNAEWQSFAAEALKAVESWSSGKGWPAGWRHTEENPGGNVKYRYTVNIRDHDMRREMDIETSAPSKKKAIANAWYRLKEMEEFTGSVGVFRARYKDRYTITAKPVGGSGSVDGVVGGLGVELKTAHSSDLRVTLEAVPNADFGEVHAPAPAMDLHVSNIEQARSACQQYIAKYGLGAGNWRRSAGRVVDAAGKYLGRFSFNGSWWPAGSEAEEDFSG